MKSFVFLSRGGCLLPALIIFNLFFGRLIFKPSHWLIIEAILLLLFLANTYLVTRKIASGFPKRHSDAIDVEGEVVQEKGKKEE